jgi:GntR family transcriptional regulator
MVRLARTENLVDRRPGPSYMDVQLYRQSHMQASFPALDRHSIVPLYYQIQQRLLDQIRSGELKPGDPVPSEHEIAARLNVSRMTARQALKSLCDLGVAYTEQGKGTFVFGSKLEKNFRQVLSFTEEMSGRRLQPSSKVLCFEVVPAADEIAAVLQVSPGEPLIKLRRVRYADLCPMGIECSYLPQSLCPDLLKTFDASASLYRTLSDRYGIQMTVADEMVEAALSSAEEARMLHIRKGSPVFVFTRTSYVQSGRPVEHVKSTYRADRYTIRHRLVRLDRKGSVLKELELAQAVP